ncbi:LysM peptidoglycan-binding domain-containing protein [Yoonia vestfoldensis]|uniref:LysM peptidoglycan-binding domain-containing protein n=1 Tax=Yoonia vestfoldensis TaxID=245188 RepID=UPI0003734A3F|nr:LysM peptidoglycan-binding domain-containing protein [Yoonia vestfoldensis]
MDDRKTSQVGAWLLGALVAVVLGGLLLYFAPSPRDAAPQVAAVPIAPDVTAPAITAEPEPEVAPRRVPTFDTFRLDPDGSMVVAGRAAPGQIVDLVLAGEAIARTTADAGGSFVILSMAGPADQPRRLSLLADPDGAAVPSDTSYMVAPTAPIMTADLTAPTQMDAQADADLPEVDLAEIAPVVAEPASPPLVLEADADGVRIAQGAAALPTPNVALDAITYDPTGEVQLAGRATGDGEVQVYLDNRPVTTSPVTPGGDWRIDLPDVDTGVYTLRIDEVDSAGEVVSRMETPFKREEAASVAAVMAEETGQDGFEVAVRTVQPGSTLWAIAEETLGDGILYVQVFEANSDLIRDPNLIYPGQIFRIPAMSQ